MIRTVSSDQKEIIRDILELHVNSDRFDADLTYSKGAFYKGGVVPEPKLKFDLYPQAEGTVKACATEVPLPSASLRSIMFDPPFLAGYTKEKPTGIMGERFHGFRYVPDLWEFYTKAISEASRLLVDGGVYVFKCQDTVSSGKNWMSHSYIMNEAVRLGFYPKDMFVLTANSRIVGHNHSNQKHARKFHSFFWVFVKTTKNRDMYATKGGK